jgi:hypothetical protein
MLELKDFMPIAFLKKEKFTGSYRGTRFRMEKLDREEEESRLGVTIWPEPYSYDATEEEKKQRAEFAFTADGIAEGVKWINDHLNF